MLFWQPVAVLFLGTLDIVRGANIFVTHYSGSVVTLSLTSAGGVFNLTQTSSLTIGGLPTWITFDSSKRLLYVSDETSWTTTSFIATISAAANGQLSLLTKTPGVVGAVATGIYGNGRFLANALFNPSTISTYKLPLNASSKALQTIKLTGKGPVPSRQEVPHPHSVFEDPTGKFLVTPDLGADQVRVYSINKDTGFLTTCPSLISSSGNGPRHAVFNGDMLYIANEISNTVDAYSITYPPAGCLTFSKKQTLTTRPGNATLPTGTKVSEIRIKDSSLYVSNRRDLLFAPNDSIATFSLDCSGEMTFLDITSSGGTYPRTFQVNAAGDLVVIGDQTTANVVVVKRDTITGVLGPQVASLRVGAAGTPEGQNGISAVIWDE